MARGRVAAKPRSDCPSCDAPLLGGLAQNEEPRCPECGELLLPVQIAALWRRAASAVVDFAILLATAGLLNWALLRLVGVEPLLAPASGIDALLRVLELDPASVLRRVAPFLAMAGLYFGLFWALTGRTVGQRLLKIRVIDRHGRSPNPPLAAVRAIGHQIGLFAGALGWVWAAFDVDKRAWHDHLARTYVVKDP